MDTEYSKRCNNYFFSFVKLLEVLELEDSLVSEDVDVEQVEHELESLERFFTPKFVLVNSNLFGSDGFSISSVEEEVTLLSLRFVLFTPGGSSLSMGSKLIVFNPYISQTIFVGFDSLVDDEFVKTCFDFCL